MQFDDRDPCDVQWVNLTDSSVFQSVYINTGLVWARRSLHTSGRNSVVGWPARVSVEVVQYHYWYNINTLCVCVYIYAIVHIIGDGISSKDQLSIETLITNLNTCVIILLLNCLSSCSHSHSLLGKMLTNKW